jgi:hypothetical protein
MVFLLIKFFGKIAYQWITVTQPFIATTVFSFFVVPVPGMGVSQDTASFFKYIEARFGFVKEYAHILLKLPKIGKL